MRPILLLPMLALAACSMPTTPEDKYFVTVNMVKATGDAVEIYVDTCKKQPQDDPCYKKFPAINSGAKAMKSAMEQASKVFVTKDSAFYDLSLTAAGNAAKALRNLLTE